VEVQDALAWALHKSGRDRQALRVERQVMRLGMRNAVFAFHAGMIQQSLGMRAAARADLTRALRICPYFNPVQAPIARQALARLGGAA
jgi:regulator of sirC expression with transglutaminase-like and TPR domain